MSRRKEQQTAISYRRVSTKQQEFGIGLEAQAVAINTYAERSGHTIVADYNDVGSGRGKDNATKRPGLKAAMDQSLSLGIPIIVSRLDRLSRETATIDDIIIGNNISVIAADTGELNNRAILGSKAAQAQFVGNRISESTKSRMKSLKAEGAVFGNPNLPEAQKRGVVARQLKAQERVQNIKTVLQEFPDGLTDKQLIDILNQRGIWTGLKRLWTISGIRRPRRAAKKQIEAERISKQLEREHYKNQPLFGRF